MESTSTSISACISKCRQAFVAVAPPEDPSSEAFRGVSDQFARFKLWAGNIGAHQIGRRSLDYRLREASHLREGVVRLLESMVESLNEARSIMTGQTLPWDKNPEVDMAEEEEYLDDLVEADHVDSVSELDQILADIVEVNESLIRLSVSIRNPAPHDRFMSSHLADTSHFEQYDINHARSKFADAEDAIVERLGKAISRRRQYLRYREQHHDKLAQGLDYSDEIEAENPASTVASSIPQGVNHRRATLESAFHLGRGYEDSSDSGRTQTSYASSSSGFNRLRVPPLPEVAKDGRPFECPFCYMMIQTDSEISWRKHVFSDLRPYNCLFPDCNIPYKDFSRRHQWMEHLLRTHCQAWKCTKCLDPPCQDQDDFRNHLVTSHDIALPVEIHGAVALVRYMKAPGSMSICPLCHETMDTAKQYQKHVGKHQEELALFALPDRGDNSDNDTGENEIEDENEDKNSDIDAIERCLVLGRRPQK